MEERKKKEKYVRWQYSSTGDHSLAADETLGVKDGALGVRGGLVLSSVSDEALAVGKSDVRRSDAIALVIRDDLNLAVDVNANAGVGGAKIDADHSAEGLSGFLRKSGTEQGHGDEDCERRIEGMVRSWVRGVEKNNPEGERVKRKVPKKTKVVLQRKSFFFFFSRTWV